MELKELQEEVIKAWDALSSVALTTNMEISEDDDKFTLLSAWAKIKFLYAARSKFGSNYQPDLINFIKENDEMLAQQVSCLTTEYEEMFKKVTTLSNGKLNDVTVQVWLHNTETLACMYLVKSKDNNTLWYCDIHKFEL